ncbi:hypothetical protein VNO77_17145 [Canavalia gladiata]|uniref:AP2/ERF domain-containing protein n=1 Tax=Canavalia gladiata TaxID=3824 RepID=A0AAN9LIJ0_CANGL
MSSSSTDAASDSKASQKYEGVEKMKDKLKYRGFVRDTDHNTGVERTSEFDKEEEAARAHDLMALKLQGSSAKTNFPESKYQHTLKVIADMTQMEALDMIRSLSISITKYISTYRGVISRDVSTGKWQAFGIGEATNRYSLGTFDIEEEAAKAFDVESIRLKGHKAVTNFSIDNYNVDDIVKAKHVKK